MSQFLARIDQISLKRISAGLDHAAQLLKAAPQGFRAPQVLDSRGSYAIFETLNCPAAVSDEHFLSKHFDDTFKKANKVERLRTSTYSPAMAYFLFQSSTSRLWWATASWSRFKRNITASEFDYSVVEPLQWAMSRVQPSDMDLAFLPKFWNGVNHIVGKLDSDLLTHSLRAMDHDVCKMALDHLHIDSDAFRDILRVSKYILTISPQDFRDAMGTTLPGTWIEQFFCSRALRRLMSSVKGDGSENETQLLDDLFSWVPHFLASNKLLQQPRVNRHLVEHLWGISQDHNRLAVIREYASQVTLQCMLHTLRKLGESKSTYDSRTAGPEMLALVEDYVKRVGSMTQKTSTLAKHTSEVLKDALFLDCEYLAADGQLISSGKELYPHSCAIHRPIWHAAADSLKDDNIVLATELLMTVGGLVGLEKIVIRPQGQLTKDQGRFNEAFDAINRLICGLLEGVNEYDPADIQKLFEKEDHAHAFVSLLSSSDAAVQSAIVETIKTVSGQTVRKEAFGDALASYFVEIINAYSRSIRRISQMRTFAPAPNMLKISKDILEVLSDSSKGLLRIETMSPPGAKATDLFWQALWQELSTIFSSTEMWSTRGHDKSKMMNFCRDVMEFAEILFDQFSVFSSAIASAPLLEKQSTSVGEQLVNQPKFAMGAMIQWLRLRDEVLLSRATALITGVLKRLRDFDSKVDDSALYFVEDVITGKTKTMLAPTQKAELHRALETHTGAVVVIDDDTPEPSKVSSKAVKRDGIDLDKWRSKANDKECSSLEKVVSANSKSVETLKASQSSRLRGSAVSAKPKIAGQKLDEGVPELVRKRQEETAARKKRDLERAALMRQQANFKFADTETTRQGSGMSGLGVVGKDHSAPKETSMMVSSSEPDSDSDELDKELFGSVISKPQRSTEAGRMALEEREKRRQQMRQQPVKKQRLARSAKDMRARLAPDLTPLHKQILVWDYFYHDTLPPLASESDYSTVLSAFNNPVDYQRTFQPLLLLEAWNGFLKARGENNASRPFEIKVTTRSNVDSYVEVSSSLGHAEAKFVGEGDIVLMSKSQIPTTASDAPHCFARVSKMQRKGQTVEVLYRAMPGNPLVRTLAPNITCYGQRIMSIVPLEREYGALLGLQYYDLCEEITRARPSPLLNYKDEALDPWMQTCSLNKAQAKAVKSALDNDAFTLIQGPPGSGKTKTIVATVGALLTESGQLTGNLNALRREIPTSANSAKKLLVCAPSNAAVDELFMRLRDGVQNTRGEHRKISVVRLGRSDNINEKVHDVTLDELVNKKMNVASEAAAREETRKLMKQHQEASQKLTDLRAKQRERRNSGDEREMELLKRTKAALSSKIDSAKDNEGMTSRRNEMKRRQVQQEIIEEAHVICATLSGSGHDMFQNISIEFDTVVIDEAAQCVELSALIPLKYGCAKCILVGDPQQLPPTVFSKQAANFKYEQSLFVRMQKNYPDAVHLLDTQYRMHPEISAFPSKAFYDGKLLDGANMASLTWRKWNAAPIFSPFQFFDVQGLHQSEPNGRSLFNLAEIEIAVQIFHRLTTDFKDINFTGRIAIITPYKGQLNKLKDRFRNDYGRDITSQIEFNTTDAFQGRESEIVIFSCVRASSHGTIGFLQDIRRMNVGLTRAKSSLWVLGNSRNLSQGEYWNKLIEHAKSTGRYVKGDLDELLGKPSIERDVDAMDTDGPENTQIKDVDMKLDSSVPPSRSSSTVPSKRRLLEEEDFDGRPGTSSPGSSGDSSIRSIKSTEMEDAAKPSEGTGPRDSDSTELKGPAAVPPPNPVARPAFRRRLRPPPGNSALLSRHGPNKRPRI